MPSTSSLFSSKKALGNCIVEAMQEKKATEVLVMDLRKVPHAITDYFVLCTAQNPVHIDAIIEHIEHSTKKVRGQRAVSIEGKGQTNWVVMDYIEIIVHIFEQTCRAHYALEELWGDASFTSIQDHSNVTF